MNQKISLDQFQVSAYKIWDSNWFLLSSGDFEKKQFNSMTISWGSFGCLWNMPLVMVVVRPSRYTYEFINRFDNFTICAFPQQYHSALSLLGSKSGRDLDKINQSGLTPSAAEKVSSPIFKEADLTIECRKLYWHDFSPDHFLDERIETNYSGNDYHRMFFGEILTISGDPDKYSIK